MRPRGDSHFLSTIGLVVLALTTLGLSAAALLQDRPISSAAITPSHYSSGAPFVSPTPVSSAEPAPEIPVETTPSATEAPATRTVVVVGDRNSSPESPDVWVPVVAKRLGWTSVTNLSTAGRGYLAKPASCDISPCSNFMGTLPAVVAAAPDVVVTFGGTADDDNDLSKAAAEYYAALRKALPEAELVAISPVTSGNTAPYWLTMHKRTIRAGVEAVGGTFIDVGQPGVGDGGELSPAAQAEIAQRIIKGLS